MKYYIEVFSSETGETVQQFEFDTEEVCAHIVPEGKQQQGLLFEATQLRMQRTGWEAHANWCQSRMGDMCDCGGWKPPSR